MKGIPAQRTVIYASVLVAAIGVAVWFAWASSKHFAAQRVELEALRLHVFVAELRVMLGMFHLSEGLPISAEVLRQQVDRLPRAPFGTARMTRVPSSRPGHAFIVEVGPVPQVSCEAAVGRIAGAEDLDLPCSKAFCNGSSTSDQAMSCLIFVPCNPDQGCEGELGEVIELSSP